MSDFKRIRENVELMASKDAPPEKIREYLATEGMTSAQFKARLEGMRDASMLEMPLKYSAGAGLANLLDMPGRGLTAAYNLEQMGKGVITGKPQDYPTADPSLLDVANPGFRKAGIINDAYEPQNGLGKVVDFATQAVTGGGVNPVAIARNAQRGMVKPIVRDLAAALASGGGAGLGSALTENINTGNPSLDNAIKIAATLGGGMASGGLIAARGTAGDRAAAATKGVTPEQMAIARELKRKAASAGSPITDYEAIQSVTGLNPKMQTQQRLAEQSDAGAQTLVPMMQNRPSANSAMFNKTADSIAPREALPDMLAGQLQTAAKRVISSLRKEGNIAAEPMYAATSNNPANKIPSANWNSLTSDDGVVAALSAVKKDPYAGLQDAQPGSLAWLDQAKKHLDGQIEAAKLKGDSFAAKQMGLAREKILAAADASFPDYAKARAIVAKNMQENVVPTEMGQVGKLAGVGEHNPHAIIPFKQQSEAFLPDAPADVTPSVVERTANALREQDPDILKRFLAQDLRRKFTEANQQNIGGENALGGAKFAAKVAGNADQEANLIAAIRSSGADAAPFQDSLDIFRAQGHKPPVNSETVANADEAGKLGGALGALSRPFKAIPGMIDQWRNGMATSDLAKALAAQDANGPLRIEELARINGVHDPIKQQMLINALMANPQNQ